MAYYSIHISSSQLYQTSLVCFSVCLAPESTVYTKIHRGPGVCPNQVRLCTSRGHFSHDSLLDLYIGPTSAAVSNVFWAHQ